MFEFECKIRVRYGETDKMGFLYYGFYSLYYEQARTEAFRSLGIIYKDMEENGIMLPVLEMKSKYIRPAGYDDLLTVKVLVKEKPATRIKTEYEIYNEKNELLNIAEVTLVFIDPKTMKPVLCPDYVMNKIENFWKA